MIGSHVVGLLNQQECEIKALFRDETKTSGGVTPIIGDLSSEHALRRLLEGADTVFHCAAELRDPAQMQAVNVLGTKRLAKLAIEAGVSAFCYLSSAGVVGPVRVQRIDEMTPCRPSSSYECSKWDAEKHLESLSGGKMRICMLRPTNVIDDDHPGIIEGLLRNNWHDRISLLIKGAECAHLIHAEDVAAAALHVVEYEDCSGAYFIGCDEDRKNTMAGVLAMVRQMLDGGRRCYIYLPAGVPYWLRRIARGGSLHGLSRFSSARLRATGFEHPLGLDESIRKICLRYKEQRL